jgi:hypothetical protein
VERRPDGWHLTLETKNDAVSTQADVPLATPDLRLRAMFDFTDLRDEVRFFLLSDGQWLPIGQSHHLVYTLDHFMGCRIGLVCFAAEENNQSRALFRDFVYMPDPEN